METSDHLEHDLHHQLIPPLEDSEAPPGLLADFAEVLCEVVEGDLPDVGEPEVVGLHEPLHHVLHAEHALELRLHVVLRIVAHPRQVHLPGLPHHLQHLRLVEDELVRVEVAQDGPERRRARILHVDGPAAAHTLVFQKQAPEVRAAAHEDSLVRGELDPIHLKSQVREAAVFEHGRHLRRVVNYRGGGLGLGHGFGHRWGHNRRESCGRRGRGRCRRRRLAL
mmetsp:Transcript_63118/g.142355  ORF Transcript_63118/g.142355 Transcript_63118/m.142355 type:complete len:223 (+) Transcript_63118:281-949(+)